VKFVTLVSKFLTITALGSIIALEQEIINILSVLSLFCCFILYLELSVESMVMNNGFYKFFVAFNVEKPVYIYGK